MVTPKKRKEKRQSRWESKRKRVTTVRLRDGYAFFCNRTETLGRVRRSTVTKRNGYT